LDSYFTHFVPSSFASDPNSMSKVAVVYFVTLFVSIASIGVIPQELDADKFAFRIAFQSPELASSFKGQGLL
jgi:hypothetical protein